MSQVTITIPSFTLSGWKTYVCAAALIGVSVAHNLGYISNDLYDILLPVLGGGGLAALRTAVSKSGPQPILDGVSNLVAAAIQMQPPAQPAEMKPAEAGLAPLRPGVAKPPADQVKESQAVHMPKAVIVAVEGNIGGNG